MSTNMSTKLRIKKLESRRSEMKRKRRWKKTKNWYRKLTT